VQISSASTKQITLYDAHFARQYQFPDVSSIIAFETEANKHPSSYRLNHKQAPFFLPSKPQASKHPSSYLLNHKQALFLLPKLDMKWPVIKAPLRLHLQMPKRRLSPRTRLLLHTIAPLHMPSVWQTDSLSMKVIRIYNEMFQTALGDEEN